MSRIAFAALTAALLAAAPAAAREHVVLMKNSGAGGVMVYEPMVVNAQVGDTVRFKPTHPSHNAEMIPTIWPAGAPPFKGKINQEIVLPVTKAGMYGIKCLPHYSMGMVMLVVAGNSNAAAAKAASLPPMAAKRIKPALSAVK